MNVEYAWDSKIYSKVYDNIDDIITAINNGTIKTFKLKEKYVPGDKITSNYEQKANRNNYEIVYTDDNHPFVLSSSSLADSVMNPIFFNKHRDVINKALLEMIKKSDESSYSIPSYLYSDELVDCLLNKKNSTIIFKDIELKDEIKKKIKDNHLEVFVEKNGIVKQISSHYVIGPYTIDQLEQSDCIHMHVEDLEGIDIDNLKYIKSSCVIMFSTPRNTKEYYQLILDFIEKLNKTENSHIVKIKIDKRSLFDEIFLDKDFSNVNLIVHDDAYDYSFSEYKNEEKRLDNIIEPIKNLDLSSLEKYLAIFNIVKNYKKYKENVNQKEESRYLRYILDNDYMVCVGFAKLLQVLCEKVGVEVKELEVSIDVSYDGGYTQEEKTVMEAGHARCVVSIDDNKYNVHGLYVSDPTWDNNLEENRLNNALMTFDKMDVAKRMFYYSIFEPVLDIHNFKEFNDQINYLLRDVMNNNRFIQNKSFIDRLLYSYNDVIKRVLNTIICDPKYNYFNNKRESCKTEKDYENLLTELGNYLLTRINKKVDDEVIIKASIYTDKVLGKESNIDDLRKSYYELDKLSFPYEIDNENDHNLIGRSK